jgi:NADH-quinone oxidoreductase subunit C
MSDTENQTPQEKAAAEEKAAAAAKAKAEREAAEAAKPAWEKDPVVPAWEEAEGDPLVDALRGSFGDAIRSARTFAGDLVLMVDRASIREVCKSVKEDHGFHLLVDMCGAHYPEREVPGYEVVYIAYNFEENRRVRLKVEVEEGVEVPSVIPAWEGANWTEREIYDMYGLRFTDHPDMTRILLWEGFNGHPLRKEFPIEGIDTGAAIYPEYYDEQAGPVAGSGTGWQPPKEEEPEESDKPDDE